MSEFIGTLYWEEFLALPSLKREALMFDSIAVSGLNSFRDNLSPEQMWLEEQRIVTEPEIHYGTEIQSDKKKRISYEYNDEDVDSAGLGRQQDRELMEHLRTRPFEIPGEFNSWQ